MSKQVLSLKPGHTLETLLQKRGDDLTIRRLAITSHLVDFASNDYLGFARSQELRNRVEQEYAGYKDVQAGATGSRLITGNSVFYEELEARIAAYHGAEVGLIYNSGYDANLGFFSSVPQPGDLVLFDELVHASIRDGIKMGRAEGIAFRHNDLEELESKLAEARAQLPFDYAQGDPIIQAAPTNQRPLNPLKGTSAALSQNDDLTGEVPFRGFRGSNTGEVPFRGFRGSNTGEVPFRGFRGSNTGEVPFRGFRGSNTGEVPFRGFRDSNTGEVPFGGFRGSNTDEVPFGGFRGSNTGEVPFRGFRGSTGEIYIATESIFSMDGDLSPLKEIAALCKKYNANLVVDEAHATGIFGAKGEGRVAELGLQKDCFARVHTFGKALGGHGAIVLGSPLLREFLINFSRSFIFTTALPLHNLVWVKCAYDLLPEQKESLAVIHALRKVLQENLHLKGDIRLQAGPGPIQAVIIPGNEHARKVAAQLEEGGIYAKAILYPTVPRGKERIRICLHNFNTAAQVVTLCQIINKALL